MLFYYRKILEYFRAKVNESESLYFLGTFLTSFEQIEIFGLKIFNFSRRFETDADTDVLSFSHHLYTSLLPPPFIYLTSSSKMVWIHQPSPLLIDVSIVQCLI